jgi:hypothetical protein
MDAPTPMAKVSVAVMTSFRLKSMEINRTRLNGCVRVLDSFACDALLPVI